MARVVSERVWRPSTPDAIEPDLAALWRELAGAETPIARAVMSNLVVFRDRRVPPNAGVDAVTADLPLDEVAARHPSRIIVLEHERGQDDPRAPFAAGVGIFTFGAPQARYGVEQIVVRSACAEASLPSIVRRLVRGDLPTTVWWTEDLSQAPPLRAIVTMGRQLLYDSRAWRDVRGGVMALASLPDGARLDLADVNWRRLTPLRRAIEHAGGPIAAASWPRDTGVRITHRPGEASLAWLLAGWLLGEGDRPEGAPLALEESGDEAALTVAMGHASGPMTATLTDRTVTIALGSSTPLVVGIPIESEADAVAAELRLLSHDPSLHNAIAALARRFSAVK